ncbi:hypothetical protein [Chitinimonas lacunae]|uniref:Uncharacterized protein n=1 Tax=Chitinimonas lacunae TaxID=1963018 RepID=A0ABV8MV20_9NEIS
MYDCLLEDNPAQFDTAATPVARPVTLAWSGFRLEKHYAGRSWARFSVRRDDDYGVLSRLREAALYLGCEVDRLDDGSIVVVGLTLNETLALSERFGERLAVEATLAGQARF